MLDSLFYVPIQRQADGVSESASCVALQAEIGDWAPEVGEEIANSIQALMQGKSMNLADAYETSRQCTEIYQAQIKHLEHVAEELSPIEAQHLTELASLASSRSKHKPNWEAQVRKAMEHYVLLRKQLTVHRYVRSVYRTIIGSVGSLNSVLHRYRRQLETVALNFETDGITGASETDAAFCMEALLSESIQEQTNDHILATEALVYDALISDYGGYTVALESASLWQNKLQLEVAKQAQRVLAEAYKKLSLDQVLANHNIPPEVLVKWLNDQMQQARPSVNNCGGGTRLLIGMPSLSENNSLEAMLAKQFDLDARVIRGTDGSFAFCFEGEEVGLANVAFRLLQEQPDALELVKRIQSRSDIEWTTLDDLL